MYTHCGCGHRQLWNIDTIFNCFMCYIVLAFYIGEGNGTPLQYSCLENPMDGGAW